MSLFYTHPSGNPNKQAWKSRMNYVCTATFAPQISISYCNSHLQPYSPHYIWISGPPWEVSVVWILLNRKRWPQWLHAGDVAATTVAVLPTKNLLWWLWSLNNNLDTFDSPSGYNSVAPTRRTTFVSSVGLMTNRLATNNQGQCYPYPGQLRKKPQICNTYFQYCSSNRYELEYCLFIAYSKYVYGIVNMWVLNSLTQT